MCGIAGFINMKGSPNLDGAKALEVMGELLSHRGPDDSGEWISQDQSVGLGEIYNYLELRESLASSWDFRSSSDTETILAAYAKYGENCVEYLRGMFAFAIWDSGKKSFSVLGIDLVSNPFTML